VGAATAPVARTLAAIAAKIKYYRRRKVKVKDCCGLEQRKSCKLWKLCSDVLHGDDPLPPCASKAVELAATTANSDYAAAQQVFLEWKEEFDTCEGVKLGFYEWLKLRLNAEIPHCA
jgi:hypothetical protein